MQDTERSSKFKLIVFNIEKPDNIGMLIRSAYAFGCEELLIVGKAKLRITGAQGTQQVMKRRRFFSLAEAVQSCRDENYRISGLEVGGQLIQNASFKCNTAFLLGNEGRGLQGSRKFCDDIFMIPQWGGVPSLNVAVAGSIAMYEFQKKQQHAPMATIHGEKFADSFFTTDS
jgi:tRNA G18 (ribose-2'-O)-methylase SpoU